MTTDGLRERIVEVLMQRSWNERAWELGDEDLIEDAEWADRVLALFGGPAAYVMRWSDGTQSVGFSPRRTNEPVAVVPLYALTETKETER